MLKYFATLLLCIPCFAQHLSQKNTVPTVEQAAIQRMAANLEALNTETSSAVKTRMEQQQVANAIAERQLQLRQDTEKLVALTAELKQRVDNTSVGVLSMEVIKKAQEIQKLAKSVQDKMKNAY